jgi:hypothetical protein
MPSVRLWWLVGNGQIRHIYGQMLHVSRVWHIVCPLTAIVDASSQVWRQDSTARSRFSQDKSVGYGTDPFSEI